MPSDTFDIEFIKEQWGELPEDVYRSILQVFVGDADALRAQTQEAVAGLKRNELARACHTIRGSAMNVGALILARCAGSLEDAATAGSPDTLSSHLAELEAAWEEVLAVIDAGGPELGFA